MTGGGIPGMGMDIENVSFLTRVGMVRLRLGVRYRERQRCAHHDRWEIPGVGMDIENVSFLTVDRPVSRHNCSHAREKVLLRVHHGEPSRDAVHRIQREPA
jgi:hypothetical protein